MAETQKMWSRRDNRSNQRTDLAYCIAWSKHGLRPVKSRKKPGRSRHRRCDVPSACDFPSKPHHSPILVRELLARQQHAAQLLERNRQLRQELSSVFLISESMRVRARQLGAQSRRASCRPSTQKLVASADSSIVRTGLTPAATSGSPLRPLGRRKARSAAPDRAGSQATGSVKKAPLLLAGPRR